jgi:hypothetical protein
MNGCEEHYVTLLRKTDKRELDKDARLEYQIRDGWQTRVTMHLTQLTSQRTTLVEKKPEVLAR